MKSNFESEGFMIQSNVISTSGIHSFIESVSTTFEAGTRNIFSIPQIRSLACSKEIRCLVENILGKNCFAVRAAFFNKSPDANWKVAYHQDITIAVKSHREVSHYGPWSVKDGITHVQPPKEVLENMLAVRIHLDDCSTENGPLRVIPGSHRNGKLLAQQIESIRLKTPEVTCLIPAGGALLMKPLILHASSKASKPSHRRVIHLEYATTELASGLEWYEKIV